VSAVLEALPFSEEGGLVGEDELPPAPQPSTPGITIASISST